MSAAVPTTAVFLGIEVSDSVSAIIEEAGEGVRRVENTDRVPPKNYHITLHCLSDLSEEQACELVSSPPVFGPFEVRVRGVGGFPSSRHPRILWAGVERSAAIRELHERLADMLCQGGLRVPTRRYNPHITLGRREHDVWRAVEDKNEDEEHCSPQQWLE